MSQTLQVFNAELKQYNGKKGKFQKVVFKDAAGTYYDSFDDWIVNVPDGTAVEGEVTSREYNGKTYYSFRASRDTANAIELTAEAVQKQAAPVSPTPVKTHVAISQTDLRMLWGNCLNAASRVHAGSGDPEKTLDSVAVFYAEGLRRFFPEVAMTEPAKPTQAPPPPSDSDIDLDSIPF